jgi:hypothetical protein
MANSFDSTDAQTLKYLQSGAAWSVGQAEKDRLFKRHPELLQSTSSTPLQNSDIALRNQQMMEDDAAQQNPISYGRAMGPAPTDSNVETSPQGDNPVVPNYSMPSASAPAQSTPVQAAMSKAQMAARLNGALGQNFYQNNISLSPSANQSAQSQSLFSKLFGGPAYQSNNQLVVPKGATSPSQINWGNNDSSADFFRADQAMRQMQKQQQQAQQSSDSGLIDLNTQPQGQKRGGAVKEPKQDPIHHALAIISHLLGHQHHAK